MPNDNVIIKCSQCGTKNRIPKDKINHKPICGKCRNPLSHMNVHDRPVDITDHSFSTEVLGSSGVILVDCWAPWCGPCRSVAPILEELAAQYAGRVKIAKLNVDENPSTAATYSIRSIPTMLLFKNGKLMDTIVGALPKAKIEDQIQRLL